MLPTQTSSSSAARKAKIKSASTFGVSKKIGMDSLSGLKKQSMVKNYYNRKIVLRVPQEIKANNPDKHFKWLNFNRVKESGMFHKDGYRIYKLDPSNDSEVKKDGLDASKFDNGWDGMIHRSEMVLGYLPVEEYEERLLEEELVRSDVDLTEIITSSDDLQNFKPTASGDIQKLSLEEVLKEAE